MGKKDTRAPAPQLPKSATGIRGFDEITEDCFLFSFYVLMLKKIA